MEAGEPAGLGGATDSRSVWFAWTAPATGRVRLNVCPKTYVSGALNHFLAVYTGNTLGTLALGASVTIAARFGVSTIAALYRLNTLKLVSEKRSGRLKREIDEGLADEVWAHLDPPPLEDGLATIGEDDLPRISPQLAGRGLEAMIRRTASVPAVARAAGCDPSALAQGAAAIGL